MLVQIKSNVFTGRIFFYLVKLTIILTIYYRVSNYKYDEN